VHCTAKSLRHLMVNRRAAGKLRRPVDKHEIPHHVAIAALCGKHLRCLAPSIPYINFTAVPQQYLAKTIVIAIR
jgi:hypothetical protein